MTSEDLIMERLARIEEKLERVIALEDKLAGFVTTWDSLHDLGGDLSLLVSPTVRKLTAGLEEVETGFQLEDIAFLLKRFLLSMRNIAWSLEQLENLSDWWHDMEPMLKLAVPHLIDLLDDLEQKGIFRINKAILNMYAKIAQRYSSEDIDIIGDGFVRMHGLVMKFSEPVVIQFFESILKMYAKIAEHYSPEDIDTIGDGFVQMHGLVKKLSDPVVINFLDKLMEVPSQVNLKESRAVGPLGLPFRLMGKEYKEGLGVAMELTKALGKIKSGNGQPPSIEETSSPK